MGTSDIKPRSRDVTDGVEKAAARGMLRGRHDGRGLRQAADRYGVVVQRDHTMQLRLQLPHRLMASAD
jgi:hypothetical protein